MLTRLCELAALLSDFIEKAHVFDGDHRLIRKCNCEFNLPIGEAPHHLPDQYYDAYRRPFAQERDTYNGTCPHFSHSLAERVFWIIEHVRDLNHASLDRCAARY